APPTAYQLEQDLGTRLAVGGLGRSAAGPAVPGRLHDCRLGGRAGYRILETISGGASNRVCGGRAAVVLCRRLCYALAVEIAAGRRRADGDWRAVGGGGLCGSLSTGRPGSTYRSERILAGRRRHLLGAVPVYFAAGDRRVFWLPRLDRFG